MFGIKTKFRFDAERKKADRKEQKKNNKRKSIESPKKN